jgi:hypothetical protein
VETLNMSYGNFLSRIKAAVRSKEQKNSGESHKMQADRGPKQCKTSKTYFIRLRKPNEILC